MLTKYLLIFLVSMVPLIELRGAVIMAVGMDLPYWESLAVCVVGKLSRLFRRLSICLFWM